MQTKSPLVFRVVYWCIYLLYPLLLIPRIVSRSFTIVADCFSAISCQAQDARHMMLCMPAPFFSTRYPGYMTRSIQRSWFDPQSTAHCASSHNGRTRAWASPRTGRPLWVSSRRRIPIPPKDLTIQLAGHLACRGNTRENSIYEFYI